MTFVNVAGEIKSADGVSASTFAPARLASGRYFRLAKMIPNWMMADRKISSTGITRRSSMAVAADRFPHLPILGKAVASTTVLPAFLRRFIINSSAGWWKLNRNASAGDMSAGTSKAVSKRGAVCGNSVAYS
ncbi:MAG: hypothetical protein NTY19_28165 [Planctomycetota bacterium]|nr:hypothetical protein [Planctomycetota bacterium]